MDRIAPIRAHKLAVCVSDILAHIDMLKDRPTLSEGLRMSYVRHGRQSVVTHPENHPKIPPTSPYNPQNVIPIPIKSIHPLATPPGLHHS